jgi:hypothetical protein
VIVAAVLLFVGAGALMAASGTVRFVPGLDEPGTRIGWRRRFGFDPATRTRPKVILTALGLSLIGSGLISLVIVLIVAA